MNLKYYLRGLGIGLIVTTVILAVADNINDSTPDRLSDAQQPTTIGSVIAYDRDNKNSEETTAAEENTTAQDIAQEQTTAHEEPVTTQPVTEPATEPATTQAATEPATTQAATQQTSQAQAAGDSVTIIVKDVYYGTQAADILYGAGLIEDRSDFIEYLTTSGYGTKIQEGTYTIPKGTDYETICRIITKAR